MSATETLMILMVENDYDNYEGFDAHPISTMPSNHILPNTDTKQRDIVYL